MTTARLLTAGESHGPCLVVIVDGFPAGIPLNEADVERELRRRQAGAGRGPRASRTVDRCRFLGGVGGKAEAGAAGGAEGAGVSGGTTTGAPVAIEIPNPEPDGEAAPGPALAPVPRPGHADLTAALKYGTPDFWPFAERASARETAARVAGGAVARALLRCLAVEVGSHVTSVGAVRSPDADCRRAATRDVPAWRDLFAAAEASPVRCADGPASALMVAAIEDAATRGDTVGGTFEVAALGCPPGLGSFAQWDRRLDGRLAAAVMSVPAVKGVEIGLGFAASTAPGSSVHDPITPGLGPAASGAQPFGVARPQNSAGGLEGGVSNGQPVVVRAAMKPIATLRVPLGSVDLRTGGPRPASRVRGDVSAVPAAAVVAEAMVAWVLAEAVLERFGADSVEAIQGGAEWWSRRWGAGRDGAGGAGSGALWGGGEAGSG